MTYYKTLSKTGMQVSIMIINGQMKKQGGRESSWVEMPTNKSEKNTGI